MGNVESIGRNNNNSHHHHNSSPVTAAGKCKHSNTLTHHNHHHNHTQLTDTFNDLKEFPPEIAISVLSNLNATDLCLASCVWQDLAEDELLWKTLCFSRWAYTSIYKSMHIPAASSLSDALSTSSARFTSKPVFKSVYMLLDEATLIYKFRAHQGIKYLIDHHIMEDDPTELAKLIHGTSAFEGRSTQLFLKDRTDVLDEFIRLQDFAGTSLCDALRRCFAKIPPPEQSGQFLNVLVEKFSARFHECNPRCDFTRENIAVLCYSLLLLSVDLFSPHVRNKMSKREFIRNNRQVMVDANRDVLSDMYDDVYLNGHVVPSLDKRRRRGGAGDKKVAKVERFPFYRPYGAIFEFKPLEMKLNCASC